MVLLKFCTIESPGSFTKYLFLGPTTVDSELIGRGYIWALEALKAPWWFQHIALAENYCSKRNRAK